MSDMNDYPTNPDGLHLDPKDESYFDTWHTFLQPICVLGLKIMGYGNGALLSTMIDGHLETILLPCWFVDRFNRHIMYDQHILDGSKE